MRILFLSTPVGAIGSGLGGGVETDLTVWVKALRDRGHTIGIISPVGSIIPEGIIAYPVHGHPHPRVQTHLHTGHTVTFPVQSVLTEMCNMALIQEQHFDVVFNMAYDWLPFYLSPLFHRPVAHFVSMSACLEVMNHIIGETVRRFPGSVAVNTQAQADTYAFNTQLRVIRKGVILPQQSVCNNSQPHLAWVGRIAPEKALEDAALAATLAKQDLYVYGMLEDPTYFSSIQQRFPCLTYQGFFDQAELFHRLSLASGLLFTSRWLKANGSVIVEAFGNVVVEAMACGVPVLAYNRGGPSEIIQPGVTGWLVTPDDPAALAAAVSHLGEINRHTCRQVALQQFNLPDAMDRIEQWLDTLVSTHPSQAISKLAA